MTGTHSQTNPQQDKKKSPSSMSCNYSQVEDVLLCPGAEVFP